jgi:hypothetical protein
VITEVIQQVASTTWFATVSHPAKPRGWDITWVPRSTRRLSGSLATAKSPTARSPPIWPSMPPRAPNRWVSCRGVSRLTTHRSMPTRAPTRGG